MQSTQQHPSRQVFLKFFALLGLLAGYFGYLSYEYNFITGGMAALITWSFFVLCTPVADAGFLLDFPLRLLFGIRMVLSEIAVWAIAISVNITALVFAPEHYNTTTLTRIMHQILTTPIPYWAVIILSGFGTFLSIRFGDELLDVIHHHDRKYFLKHHFKHEILLFIFFLMVLFGYFELMTSLDMNAAH